MSYIRLVKNTYLNLFAIAGLSLAATAIAPAAFAQQVTNVNPTVNGQNVPSDSSIYGSFDVSTGRIDQRSVKIFVNNQDVTAQSVITGNFFSFRPTQPLRPGENLVRVEFKNTNGQGFAANWSFQVEQPRAEIDITSVSHNAGTTLGAGSTFLATINGTPGARATVLILDGTTMRNIPAQEVSPGVYVATLNLTANDRFNEGIVIGRLERNNRAVFNAASQAVAFQPNAASTQVTQVQTTPTTPGQPTTTPQQPVTTPGQPTTNPLVNLQPSFTSHQDGGMVTTAQGFTLTGQTQPNASVRIVVTNPVPLIGESTLVDTMVRADANGTFSVPIPRPLILTGGMRYNVTAIANNGTQTAQTRITLTQR